MRPLALAPRHVGRRPTLWARPMMQDFCGGMGADARARRDRAAARGPASDDGRLVEAPLMDAQVAPAVATPALGPPPHSDAPIPNVSSRGLVARCY